MLIKTESPYLAGVKPSEITSESAYLQRRSLLKAAGLGALSFMAVGPALVSASDKKASDKKASDKKARQLYEVDQPATGPDWLKKKLAGTSPGPFSTPEDVTPWEYVTSYNNFYEFGTDKSDPSEKAGDLITDPWSLKVDGEAEKTGTFTLEDIMKPHALEERVYRLRCVEAWSMVVPWIGFPLGDLLKRFKPTSRAKYVRFKTLYDPKQMPGQRSFFSSIDYPYVEGLRMDEAMNELAFMAVGLYGKAIPNQNGAPIRLVVPWKYGFKSIKSIVGISFTARQPKTTWEITNSREYGFYANVNPEVSHPRWSQATERRLPSSFFSRNTIDTRMFNGYGPQVASLYRGMDLTRNY